MKNLKLQNTKTLYQGVTSKEWRVTKPLPVG